MFPERGLPLTLMKQVVTSFPPPIFHPHNSLTFLLIKVSDVTLRKLTKGKARCRWRQSARDGGDEGVGWKRKRQGAGTPQ